MIAGAGISVSAGIPDFRSSTGLFKSLRNEHSLRSSGKDLFDASVYQNDSSTSSFHNMVRSLSQKTKSAEPTAFHHLIATLAHEGRLLRLYTQNVDGIDTSLEPLKTVVPLPKKAPWPKSIQLHGGLDKMVCSKCHKLSDFEADLFDGPVPPSCMDCEENDGVRVEAGLRSHGIGKLRPRMVLYNEHNPDDEAIGSVTRMDLRTRPDAVIVAGTTLKVPGVRRITREMCGIVRDRRDGVTVWINNDPEPISKDLENCWDLVVRGPCDEVARHAGMRKWDDTSEFREVTDEELQRVREQSRPEVVIISPKKSKAFVQVQGQLVTPVASPRMAPRESLEAPPPSQDLSTPTKKQKSIMTDNVAVVVGKGKDTKPAVKKRPAQPKKATTAKNATNKITNAFTVSKTQTKQTIKLRLKSSEEASVNSKPKSQSRGKKVEPSAISIPMAPISLQAARNNTSPPHNPPAPSTLPNLKKSVKVESNPTSSEEKKPSMKERMGGTISPKGPLPRDLARLVDV